MSDDLPKAGSKSASTKSGGTKVDGVVLYRLTIVEGAQQKDSDRITEVEQEQIRFRSELDELNDAKGRVRELEINDAEERGRREERKALGGTAMEHLKKPWVVGGGVGTAIVGAAAAIWKLVMGGGE